MQQCNSMGIVAFLQYFVPNNVWRKNIGFFNSTMQQHYTKPLQLLFINTTPN